MPSAARSNSDFKGDRLDVRMFGAVGDGATSDTAAIQDAVDWIYTNLGGGTLLIPSGTYLLSGPIVMKEHVILRGCGVSATTLAISTDIAAIGGPAAGNIKHCGLSDLTISKTGALAGTGCNLCGIWNSFIENVVFLNLSIAVMLDGTTQGCYFNSVAHCRATGCTTGIKLTGGAGAGANSNTIRDNRIDNCVTGILGESGTNTVQGNLLLRNDIEEPATGTSVCIDYAGDNSILEGNWVEGVAGAGDTFTGIKLRGGGNVCLNNKYSLVVSGGAITQLDKDDSLINSFVESSTGGEPLFQLAGGIVGALLNLISVSGPSRLRIKRADNAVNKRYWELSVTTDGLFISHLNDALATINSPFHIDDTGAIYLNRDVYTGGASQHTRIRARSADETITAQLFAYDGLGGVVGTLTNHAFRIRTNDTDAAIIGTDLSFATLGAIAPYNTTAKLYSGNGNPEGSITASVGSIWLRADGGSGTSFYVKESGTGNTGWVAKTTLSLPVTVPNGGTGATTLTDHGVLLGSGTAAVDATSAGTSGQVLTSNGASADPTFQDHPAAFYDRGDPASSDKTQATLTIDSAWHDWDLSSIAPAGTTSVLLRVQLSNSTNVGVGIHLRENGNSNVVNYSSVRVFVAAVTHAFDIIVACDANRIIEYNVDNTGSWTMAVTVAGWWK